ncbi:hypothetical protein D3C77_763140 [compost metagenome]
MQRAGQGNGAERAEPLGQRAFPVEFEVLEDGGEIEQATAVAIQFDVGGVQHGSLVAAHG